MLCIISMEVEVTTKERRCQSQPRRSRCLSSLIFLLQAQSTKPATMHRASNRTGTTLRTELQREDEQKWEWVVPKGGVQHISSVSRLRTTCAQTRKSGSGPGRRTRRRATQAPLTVVRSLQGSVMQQSGTKLATMATRSVAVQTEDPSCGALSCGTVAGLRDERDKRPCSCAIEESSSSADRVARCCKEPTPPSSLTSRLPLPFTSTSTPFIPTTAPLSARYTTSGPTLIVLLHTASGSNRRQA